GWTKELQAEVNAIMAQRGRRSLDDKPQRGPLRPVGVVATAPQPEVVPVESPKTTPKRPVADPDVVVFFCSEKYPDCKRFFDTARGWNFHWKRDHGEQPVRKNKKRAEGDAEDEE